MSEPVANIHHPLPIRQPVPNVCAMIRSRGSFEEHSDGTDWRHGESTTAAYWCLATMEHAGPDDHYVHPHLCLAGRRCFHAPE